MTLTNENTQIMLIVSGYTEFPERYSNEHVAENALDCALFFDREKPEYHGVCFNELLQTEEVQTIAQGLGRIVSGETDCMKYDSEYIFFRFHVEKQNEGYRVWFRTRDGNADLDADEVFLISEDHLREIEEEFRTLARNYPVRLTIEEMLERDEVTEHFAEPPENSNASPQIICDWA